MLGPGFGRGHEEAGPIAFPEDPGELVALRPFVEVDFVFAISGSAGEELAAAGFRAQCRSPAEMVLWGFGSGAGRRELGELGGELVAADQLAGL